MTKEDHLAAKLAGYSVVVKFKDGEELFLKIDDFDKKEFLFEDIERFINGTNDDDDNVGYFPAPDIAIASSTIKYVKAL